MERRDFIVATSAAVVGATARAAETASPAPQAFRSPAGGLIPYRSADLVKTGPQRTFTGDALSEIAFPLGGIGTGTISLGGRGQLRDFEIFNRPAKGKTLPFTFAALWARAEGERPSRASKAGDHSVRSDLPPRPAEELAGASMTPRRLASTVPGADRSWLSRQAGSGPAHPSFSSRSLPGIPSLSSAARATRPPTPLPPRSSRLASLG